MLKGNDAELVIWGRVKNPVKLILGIPCLEELLGMTFTGFQDSLPGIKPEEHIACFRKVRRKRGN